jgi:hypothetical protein
MFIKKTISSTYSKFDLFEILPAHFHRGYTLPPLGHWKKSHAPLSTSEQISSCPFPAPSLPLLPLATFVKMSGLHHRKHEIMSGKCRERAEAPRPGSVRRTGCRIRTRAGRDGFSPGTWRDYGRFVAGLTEPETIAWIFH